MEQRLVYPVGSTGAVQYAAKALPFPLIDHPAPDVTHLLLDVPSFRADGSLRDGSDVEKILERLPEGITVIGGNLTHPMLAGYTCIDLLQDDTYVAQNAAITARCAVRAALPQLGITLLHCPVLILGWGRIGKCLGRLLDNLGADVTIAARKESDRAMIRALGYGAVGMEGLGESIHRFRLLYNTVPVMVLPETAAKKTRADCVKIELASKPGIEGPDVIDARGLPGKLAPESSGALIAQTVTRLLKEEKQ